MAMLPGPLARSEPPEPPAIVQARPSIGFEGGLTVEFDEWSYDAAEQRYVFTGETVATYGETVVRTPRLVVDADDRTGEASGGAVVTDPAGTLQTSSFTFDWQERTGTANEVVVQIGYVRMSGERLDVRPGLWRLTKAEGELSESGGAAAKFEASSVDFSPGRSGVARNVYLRVLGARLGPIPRMPFSLRKRLKGFGWPSITNRRGEGLGLNWEAGLAIGDYSAANVFWSAFPKSAASYGLQIAYSPLDPDSPTPIAPRSDLGERAVDSWFGNVSVRNPEEEDGGLRDRRITYAAGSSWNQGTTGRPADSETVSKQWEAVGEWGGEVAGFGTLATVRYQSVRPDRDRSFVERAVLDLTVQAPVFKLGDAVSVRLRADAFAALGGSNYGFVRGEAGIVGRPVRGLTLGVAYVSARETGTADFGYDQFGPSSALHLRADWRQGPYTVRYLAKYDIGKKDWYDREYEIALAAQAFEPFVVFREFPSDFRIGVRFRIDPFVDRLQRRKQNR
jgi:hypothetical protein